MDDCRPLNHCVSAPTIIKTIRAFCQCCGRLTDYGVMVIIREQFRKGNWHGPIMMCANCRERHVNRWAVAPGWHDGLRDFRDKPLSPAEWAAWCEANPPLESLE